MVRSPCRRLRRPDQLYQVQGRPVEPDLSASTRRTAPTSCAASPSANCCRPRMPSTASTRAMHALGPTGFPVPRTYGLCDDPRCSARSSSSWASPTDARLWNGALPDSTPDERRGIYNAMIDTHGRSAPEEPAGHRAWRIRQADRLLRAADRPLVEAVQAVRNRAHAQDGAADRMAAANHPAAAREQRGPWRLPARQSDLRA